MVRPPRFSRVLSLGAVSLGAIAGMTCAALADDDTSATTSLPEVAVTATRLDDGIVGASTTVITAEEIARTPAATLSEILARQPGIQTRSMFGSTGGSYDTVDMRGFGAAATSNTLILLNGRRLNDGDMSSVDLSAIPKSAIERIEIIRGNAGAVLYGDGAMGGVINIITKTGAGQPASVSLDGGVGSNRYRDSNASVSQSVGPVSATATANLIESDGYRTNSELSQRNVTGEVRYTGNDRDYYLNFGADRQHQGLPGSRTVTLSSSLVASDPSGTATPFDYSDKQGLSVAFGGSWSLNAANELIVDAGIRRKDQQWAYFSSWGSAYDSYGDTTLTTVSLTPRLKTQHTLFGLPAKTISGLDLYHSFYDSDRKLHEDDKPYRVYDIDQTSAGLYTQNTTALRPDTDLSLGGRLQYTHVRASDSVDTSANGGTGLVAGLPLSDDDLQPALHLGIEHRPWNDLTLFARTGRSVRVPNVDERAGQGAYGTANTYALKTQTSQDLEAGARGTWGRLDWSGSTYIMNLRDELHYSPATYTNVNLDPTRRWGVETSAGYALSDRIRLRAALAYTRAQFREGEWKGNDVPLVSRWSGNTGLSWDLWERYVVFDGDVRLIGRRRMDNDQANVQPQIPGTALMDLRLGGQIEWLRWSVLVQNVFDHDTYDYAIASATTYGTYNAYTQPGRTFLARIGVQF